MAYKPRFSADEYWVWHACACGGLAHALHADEHNLRRQLGRAFLDFGEKVVVHFLPLLV
jgi:hypothetical protein